MINIIEVISDPIDGPFEGIDFCVDSDGFVQVETARTAALILRKVNTSGLFDTKLVKLARKGDCVILGFDDLATTTAVFSDMIGYQKTVYAEVKQDQSGKFCIYLDGKRLSRMYGKLSAAKSFIKKHDKELQTLGETVESYEDIEF